MQTVCNRQNLTKADKNGHIDLSQPVIFSNIVTPNDKSINCQKCATDNHTLPLGKRLFASAGKRVIEKKRAREHLLLFVLSIAEELSMRSLSIAQELSMLSL
jgi:hypothetical protein